MGIAITGVDATLVGWLSRNADPRLDRTALQALDKAVEYFATMSGRLGHYLTDKDVPTHRIAEGGVSAALGLYNHDRLIKTLQASKMGTLYGRIESRDESTSWGEGTLTLDRRRHPIPHAILGSLVGRELREVVKADWLAPGACIVAIDENAINVKLTCDNWIIPLDEARETLKRKEKA